MRKINLKGKVVWLTGASSGIGEALAYELAKRGARVALTARRAEQLERIRKELMASGAEVECFAGDVLDLAAMRDVANRIEERMGPIDVAIANAGTHIFTVPESFNSAEYMSIMNLNFGGTLHCVEAVLPRMLERGAGVIAPVASLAGYRGLPRAAAYGASKAAMINFFESVRFHVAPKGVWVSIINPGFVKTPLTDKNDFKMPFLIDAPRAASIILDGLERGKREIAFPFPFNWILKLAKMLPAPLYESIVNRCW
ncbi:MAG: SDR family NAD(P)-dependent oxidoreductase [Pseudomonadota bacterium]